MGRIRLGLIVALIAFAAVTTADAAPPKGFVRASEVSAKTRLQAGIAFYDALEWEDAREALTAAVAENLSREDAATAHWYLALIAYAQDSRKDAEDALYETLRANPKFALPTEYRGSDMETIFESAWERTDRLPPEISLSVPANVRVGDRVTVVAVVADRSAVEAVVLDARSANGAFVSVTMTQEGNAWRADLPESLTVQAGSSELSATATDAWGNVGRQTARLLVLPKPVEPAAKRGGRRWLYAAGGVFASVGASVAAYLLLRAEPQDGHNGNGTETETWDPGLPPEPPTAP